MKYKKPIITFLIAAAVILTALYLFEKNDRFLSLEIKSNHPYEPAFETHPLTHTEFDEVEKALSQKYNYLTSGGQAFVFLSEDGKYALKFFKQRHFRQPTYLNYFPFIDGYRKLKFAKRKMKIDQEYGSYKIGFEELSKETALIYLHLNKTNHFKRSITLVDRLNFEHRVDLDTTDYILQRRAHLVTETINDQMKARNVLAAQKTISSVVDLIVHRCKLGYGDKDPSIIKNCGIFEGRAMKIDVGRFYHDERMKNPLFYKPELLHLSRKFRKWLSVNHPELTSYLDAEVQKVILHD